ncbi:bifunctional aminoglycoside phosphotransferase/ATP-binding protein [Noviherbaspirillum sp. UKPF54]|uniref:bifunctional aminoglycoside phosphotransferase/ATP-binding protein n=1 Tax=Noviherbaspirillum sp. UKPF54 TaxID=2601898 RepID=UPI0011B196E1|nr:bifunctional aminoglycoside phosphotransferase/ATP-binding protein [Noviherbaspirillum sp. UKPF54]QDZ27964.1 aminoglycoside phosphotransferase [Noviherbaspirillum sp. UKPF54]
MSEGADLERQRILVAALAAALEREHGRVERFETHISWVLVAGEFAYKFKKALRFDFLDFSTLDARHFYCREEVRLNSRLAPEIYLGVLAVGGTAQHPLLGQGEAIEYCVRMRAFPQDALWASRLRRQLLTGEEVDDLALRVGQFHLAAARAPVVTPWGDTAQLRQVAHDNLAQIAASIPGAAPEIQAWVPQQLLRLDALFAMRKRAGYVREGHGDLHGGNIVTLDGKAQAFDCIEFNEDLRWIDVINDIAFVYMDLRFQGCEGLAARCLNRYLETTGDYEGVRLLRYYQVQRALVRSKIALLYAAQPGISRREAQMHEREGFAYLEYAAREISTAPAAIMITHGFSGSGKSVFARHVVECAGALQLRSDVERKRLHGDTCSGQEQPLAAGLYAEDATRRTYARLLALTRVLAEEGVPVVVDAAFLKQEQRAGFMTLADELNVPFFIVDLRASEATMRARVALRKAQGEDASDAGVEVLLHQLGHHDPLSDVELQHTVPVDAESGLDLCGVQALCERIALGRRR